MLNIINPKEIKICSLYPHKVTRHNVTQQPSHNKCAKY